MAFVWTIPTRADSLPSPLESGPLFDLPPFERAVVVIKHFETLHRPKDWPFVGYGHMVQAGEPYRKGVQLNEMQAEMLLRRDLKKFCSMFRHIGADSLLAGVLAYNVGPYRLLGTSKTPKSQLLIKLEQGDRDIFLDYLSFCRYKGRVHQGIRTRRLLEYKLLYAK